MLVMSRRQGETILIGDEIEIVIAHIGRSRVKVGIRAPRQMPVIAREMKLVREENLAAAAGDSGVGVVRPAGASSTVIQRYTEPLNAPPQNRMLAKRKKGFHHAVFYSN